MTATAFRFDAADHAYYLGDTQIPSITQMLAQTGWIDDQWFTEDSRIRGTAVHDLTQAYDLGALDLTDPEAGGMYRGWLLGHAAAMQALNPTWESIEEAEVHPGYRFGGRPDRVGRIYGAQAVLDLKSGAVQKAHAIQTALQAILVSGSRALPAHRWERYGLYLTPTGKFKMVRHADLADLAVAQEVIRVCCS